MSLTTPDEIIDFWQEAGNARWFSRDLAFDHEIRERFAAAHADAAAGRLAHWAETPAGALALVLILDQFSRNIFRDDKRAFAADPLALRTARAALDAGFDAHVDPPLRVFFYMPFMHSEALADQDRCVALFEAEAGAEENLAFARDHRDIIARFGRFPHRNPLLGRTTTAEEQRFLDEGGFKG